MKAISQILQIFQPIFANECAALDGVLDGVYTDREKLSPDAPTETLTLGKVSVKNVHDIQKSKKRGRIIGSVAPNWTKTDKNWPGVVLKQADHTNLKRNVPKILDKSTISLFRLGGRHLQFFEKCL